MIPASFLDEVRARVPLSTVIGRRVRLIRRGREHVALCPFHNEKTPSFTVVEDKGFFHCHGCGAHGDVIGFEMRAGGLSFIEAVERLAAEAGLDVPKPTPEDREKARRDATLLDVLEAAAAFFERQLRMPAGRPALDYLTGRAVTDATLARFRLGYAPTGNALKAALKREGLDDVDLLLAAGLLVQPDDGRPAYDYFRDRVMFPITDRRGRVIAFGGRVMGDGQPKYLNSPDTALFHKGSVLYGLAQARGPALERGSVIVAEGYMDVIGLSQAGFTHAVAPLGTALTETQIEALWHLAPEPTLCFDGDAAGRRAATRAADRVLPVLKPGCSLRFAWLPEGKDPDDLVRGGGEAAMAAVLDSAQPLFDVVWRTLTEGRALDTPERRASLENDVESLAGRIADPAVRGYYRRQLRDRIWEEFLARKRGPRGGPQTGSITPFPKMREPEVDTAAHADIVSHSFAHPRVLLPLVEEVAAALASATQALKILFDAGSDIVARTPDIDSRTLQAELEATPHTVALDRIIDRVLRLRRQFEASIATDRNLQRIQTEITRIEDRLAAPDLHPLEVPDLRRARDDLYHHLDHGPGEELRRKLHMVECIEAFIDVVAKYKDFATEFTAESDNDNNQDGWDRYVAAYHDYLQKVAED